MGGAIAESLDPTLYSLTVTAASQASLDKIAKVCPAAECSPVECLGGQGC